MMREPWTDPAIYDAMLPPTLLTPALAFYPAHVRSNIGITLRLLGGDAARWRPHLKTVKAESMMRLMVSMGLKQAKCATLLELEIACRAGFIDVLLSMPLVGPAVQRLQELSKAFPVVRMSVLVESIFHVKLWQGSRFRLLIDVNGGMDRTGIEQSRVQEIVAIAREIQANGCEFGGLHYYDGHVTDSCLSVREVRAHQGYDQLMIIVEALEANAFALEEVITAGTTSFPCALSYSGFRGKLFRHVCSPGTLVYNDLTSLGQLPAEWGYRPGGVVLSRIMSAPTTKRITLDAGHKAVSVDLGIPNGLLLEIPNARLLKPSEEHLPVDISDVREEIVLGRLVHIVPRHICTTVNNFNDALLIENGAITGSVGLTARGHQRPLP